MMRSEKNKYLLGKFHGWGKLMGGLLVILLTPSLVVSEGKRNEPSHGFDGPRGLSRS